MRLWIQVGASAAIIYALLWQFTGPDLRDFLYPWLAHIREAGPVDAFSNPFSNYTPPYLYLMAAVSSLGLTPLATVKLISVAATLWLAWCVRSLLNALECKKADEAALLSLLLPSVLFNGPMIGQCDALWVAPCLLSVAAAAQRRTMAMASWAGLAFAIKAQAGFLAPFALAVVIRERKWAAVGIPPSIYFAAVTPAWLAGWPLADLLTIYVQQYEYFPWLSVAPNLLAIPRMLDLSGSWLFAVAYTSTAIALVVYLWRFPKPMLRAALISATFVPFLLPKMHERYFFLADLLALCLAYMHRNGLPVLVCVQLGSIMSLMAYALALPVLNVVGGIFMGTALLLMLRLRQDGGARAVVKPPTLNVASAEA